MNFCTSLFSKIAFLKEAKTASNKTKNCFPFLIIKNFKITKVPTRTAKKISARFSQVWAMVKDWVKIYPGKIHSSDQPIDPKIFQKINLRRFIPTDPAIKGTSSLMLGIKRPKKILLAPCWLKKFFALSKCLRFKSQVSFFVHCAPYF